MFMDSKRTNNKEGYVKAYQKAITQIVENSDNVEFLKFVYSVAVTYKESNQETNITYSQ